MKKICEINAELAPAIENLKKAVTEELMPAMLQVVWMQKKFNKILAKIWRKK